jgi:hypothetical protein
VSYRAVVYLDPKTCQKLNDPDALSVSDCTVFRNGGRVADCAAVDGKAPMQDAIPYVSVPRLKKLLEKLNVTVEVIEQIRNWHRE